MADERETREEGHKYAYRTLFDTVAGYMAPTPGKLYTISPRRRVRGTLNSSSATAASAFNTFATNVALVDTLGTTDGLWLELFIADLGANIAGQATVQAASVNLTNAGGTSLLPIGQIVQTTLVVSSTGVTTLCVAFLSPFISFQDIVQSAQLRGATFGQPFSLSMNIGFLNGAGVNQVVTSTAEALYRKVSSIQEG